MSEKLDQLKTAVDAWYDQAKTDLTSEAEFLKKMAEGVDDVTLAETYAGERFSDLIADTIAELVG